jgi:hypothetical protein
MLFLLISPGVRIRDAAENQGQFFNPQAPLEIAQSLTLV